MNRSNDWTFHPPDWKDAKNYPDPKKMTDPQWGWEFLRRNPDFWKDGRELRDLFHHLSGTEEPNEIFKWDIREGERVYLTDSGGWDRPFAMKAGGEVGYNDLQRKLRIFHNKWGVDPVPLVTHHKPNTPFAYLHDGAWGRPRLLEAGSTFRPSPFPPVTVPRLQGVNLPFWAGDYYGIPVLDDLGPEEGHGDSSAMLCRYPAQVAMVFDLRQAWDAQERKAREVFAAIQQHLKDVKALEQKRSDKSDLFPRYLQILDARANGASIREIVSIVFPERISNTSSNGFFNQNLKAGEYWRNEGFLLLLNH